MYDSRFSIRIIGFLGLLLVCQGCGESAPRLAEEDAAPRFQTIFLDGRELKFPEHYRGKVVALRFWADWCPYCAHEMGEIEPVYRKLEPQGLSVLAINVGQSREAAQRFIDRLGVSYDVGLDESSEVARKYGVVGLPTTFIIDQHGTVKRKILGESDAATLRTLATELL